jgi:hypothetical protein
VLVFNLLPEGASLEVTGEEEERAEDDDDDEDDEFFTASRGAESLVFSLQRHHGFTVTVS